MKHNQKTTDTKNRRILIQSRLYVTFSWMFLFFCLNSLFNFKFAKKTIRSPFVFKQSLSKQERKQLFSAHHHQYCTQKLLSPYDVNANSNAATVRFCQILPIWLRCSMYGFFCISCTDLDTFVSLSRLIELKINRWI